MKIGSRKILMLCLIAGLLSACSRSEVQKNASRSTTQSPLSSPAPLATEASVTTAAPPVADRPGPQAAPVAIPPEDRMEPVSVENARLPGGGKLEAEPAPEKRKK